MTTRLRINIWIIVIVLAALTVSALTFASRPATAQETRANDLYELLNRLSSENKSVTFQFDRPFLSGETLLTLPDTTGGRALDEIGLDYVCFSEPWNDTRRVQCTPYSNIVGVSYAE